MKSEKNLCERHEKALGTKVENLRTGMGNTRETDPEGYKASV